MASFAVLSSRSSRQNNVKAIALLVVFALAAYFVGRYVFPYYLHFDANGLGDYWPKRFWLVLHITSGMTAILVGPWQFSTRLRQRSLRLHRYLGRVYLIAIVCGSMAAFRLAATATLGWAWSFGLAALAVAWLTTSGMAYYTILKRRIVAHKEWMVRSYVITFAFATFRYLVDVGPTSRLQPVSDRYVTCLWSAWVLPLLAAEVIFELRRLRTAELRPQRSS